MYLNIKLYINTYTHIYAYSYVFIFDTKPAIKFRFYINVSKFKIK